MYPLRAVPTLDSRQLSLYYRDNLPVPAGDLSEPMASPGCCRPRTTRAPCWTATRSPRSRRCRPAVGTAAAGRPLNHARVWLLILTVSVSSHLLLLPFRAGEAPP